MFFFKLYIEVINIFCKICKYLCSIDLSVWWDMDFRNMRLNKDINFMYYYYFDVFIFLKFFNIMYWMGLVEKEKVWWY